MGPIERARRILLVDDSSTSRMITKRCFEMAVDPDVEFLEAPDGAEALTVLEENEVDLVVTDINMPKMDGVTFVWKVRMHKATANLPVIVLSSMKNDRLKSALQGLGVEIFIQKPISHAKIAEYVEEPV